MTLKVNTHEAVIPRSPHPQPLVCNCFPCLQIYLLWIISRQWTPATRRLSSLVYFGKDVLEVPGAGISTSFLLVTEKCGIVGLRPHFIHASEDGPLLCFYLLAIVKRAAVNSLSPSAA